MLDGRLAGTPHACSSLAGDVLTYHREVLWDNGLSALGARAAGFQVEK